MARKPTKTQLNIVAMTRRSPLIKTLFEDKKLRWSLADGCSISQSAAEKCVRHGLLQPVGDGLFGESQSWAAP